MDSHQHAALLKMFNAYRLHPHLPEHHLFIKGELAKLEVVDQSAAEQFKKFYSDKLAQYVIDHPEEFPLPEPVKEEVKEEVVDPVVLPEEEKAEVVKEPKKAKEPKKKII